MRILSTNNYQMQNGKQNINFEARQFDASFVAELLAKYVPGVFQLDTVLLKEGISFINGSEKCTILKAERDAIVTAEKNAATGREVAVKVLSNARKLTPTGINRTICRVSNLSEKEMFKKGIIKMLSKPKVQKAIRELLT